MIPGSDYKAKYQMWDEDAFWSGEGVRAMNPFQRWMYRTLLQSSFSGASRPFLPNDDDRLWMLAGCENREQWDKNKKLVKAQFEEHEFNGNSFIGHKRVLRDWKYLSSQRETTSKVMSALGKASAQARQRAVNESLTVGEPAADDPSTKVSKKVSKFEESKKEREIDNRPSYALKQIPRIALEVLGVSVRYFGQDKETLKSLVSLHGADKLLTAFKAFCESKAGETINYPVSAFLKSSGAFLGGVLAKVTTPELQNLGAALYEIGNQPFAGHDLYALNSLRENYSDEEIIGAYREFVSGQDDFQMKRAAKTFAGAGEAILLARRKRAEEDRRGEEFAEKASSILRKKAEEEEKTLDEDKFAPSF